MFPYANTIKPLIPSCIDFLQLSCMNVFLHLDCTTFVVNYVKFDLLMHLSLFPNNILAGESNLKMSKNTISICRITKLVALIEYSIVIYIHPMLIATLLPILCKWEQ